MYEDAIQASKEKLTALKQAELDRLDGMIWNLFENIRIIPCRIKFYTTHWSTLLGESYITKMYSVNSDEEIIRYYEPYFEVSTLDEGRGMKIWLELTAEIIHNYQVQFKEVQSNKKRFPWSKPVTVTEKIPATAYDRLILSYQQEYSDEYVENLIEKRISESLNAVCELPLTHPAAYAVMHFVDKSNELEYWPSAIDSTIYVRVKTKFSY